jgi:hypothetical protein
MSELDIYNENEVSQWLINHPNVDERKNLYKKVYANLLSLSYKEGRTEDDIKKLRTIAAINELVARNLENIEQIRSEIVNGNTTTTGLLNIGNLYKDISILNGGAGSGKRKYKSKKNKRTKTNKKSYKKRGYKKRTRKYSRKYSRKH